MRLLPTGPQSELILVPLDESNAEFAHKTLRDRLLKRNNVTSLDVVIANAGTTPGFVDILSTDPDTAQHCLNVNSVGPLRLFQACWPLLMRSDGADPRKRKFVLMTSSWGSIGLIDDEFIPNTAYSMSKAAANLFARKLSMEFKGNELKVGIIHPG